MGEGGLIAIKLPCAHPFLTKLELAIMVDEIVNCYFNHLTHGGTQQFCNGEAWHPAARRPFQNHNGIQTKTYIPAFPQV